MRQIVIYLFLEVDGPRVIIKIHHLSHRELHSNKPGMTSPKRSPNPAHGNNEPLPSPNRSIPTQTIPNYKSLNEITNPEQDL